ncbi:hypothetical protein HETIRDRAFT_326449 [Heterobasidion irregulare TC 32-1]|uniref:Integrase catalytic domain-containing protein n=1 Tax=Heterobasidion irregulare (strain TC 32-1) TaxID=747525 RepID=W4JW11_HETIT|nr:uncharacterized protein HETIRDRAFT_326449 [Heterobasidion irregulare TC 32-1]ETW77066.1 hypothetical protein HETIRDRAFT_326449 [Heterobasidion irregulare TC 32-1]
MPNQYKPLSPEDELEPWIKLYYHLGLTDIQIAELTLENFDREVFGLGSIWTRVKQKWFSACKKKWGLKSTQQQAHTIETIAVHVAEIKRCFPNRGLTPLPRPSELRTTSAFLGKKFSLPDICEVSTSFWHRALVAKYLTLTEPEAVKKHRHQKFKRHMFWAAGLNSIWAMDQHNKFIHWMKIWWTNQNPRLIASFYIETACCEKGIPLIMQSDPGSENFGVANAHTLWMRKYQNIKPESHWSILLLFRWLAIPWLQCKLDAWVYQRNMTAHHANRHKILPHGIPELICQQPHHYDSIDFKVVISDALINELEQRWALPAHDVFKLVLDKFVDRIQPLYLNLSEPQVSFDLFWNIFCHLI